MLSLFPFCQLVVLLTLNLESIQSRVVEYGPKLPELIRDYPQKSFLIRFYDPYRCKGLDCGQTDIVYKNVAERIYHRHDDLIVGQVNCYENAEVCSQYGSSEAKKAAFIGASLVSNFKGRWAEEDLYNFASRLIGPDVNTVEDCMHLKYKLKEHKMLILFIGPSKSSTEFLAFETIAKKLKPDYWFYKYQGYCRELAPTDGIYILRDPISRGQRYEMYKQDTITDYKDVNFQNSLEIWIQENAFPIFGQLEESKLESLTIDKPHILAVLDFFKPLKKFEKFSSRFYDIVERIAIDSFQDYNIRIRFAWLPEAKSVERLIMTQPVPLPNLILLYPNGTYHLAIREENSADAVSLRKDPKLFAQQFVTLAETNKLVLSGGDSYIILLARFLYKFWHTFCVIYKADPLIAALVYLIPTGSYIMISWDYNLAMARFVYMQIFGRYDRINNNPNDDDGEEEQQNRNHIVNNNQNGFKRTHQD